MVFLGLLGFLFGAIYIQNNLLGVLIGLVMMMLPLLYLLNLKQKRMEKFKHQLPEGLDLIARALKAGHALSGAMALAADEQTRHLPIRERLRYAWAPISSLCPN